MAEPSRRVRRAGSLRRLGAGRAGLAPPGVAFILAHIGGGGDWLQSLPAIRGGSNILVDLSGSGVDGGMLEACIESVGVPRLLWGCDLTIDTGWAKLRRLEHLLSAAELELGTWGNAVRIFPSGAFRTD